VHTPAARRSGIRPETVKQMLLALEKNCISRVPAKGTVGASGTPHTALPVPWATCWWQRACTRTGDLAPLAHLALGLIGEGPMWDPTLKQFREPAGDVGRVALAAQRAGGRAGWLAAG
jgi:histidine ammonia-lyase